MRVVGVKLKGLLVPINREEDRILRKSSQSSDGLQDDREFSPLRYIDTMGNQKEIRKSVNNFLHSIHIHVVQILLGLVVHVILYMTR